MSIFPTFQPRPARFRGPSSSGDQNAMMNEALFDLVNLFNHLNEQERKLENLQNLLLVENKHRAIRIAELESKLAQAYALLKQLEEGEGKYSVRAHVYDMWVDETVAEQERASIDKVHGLVTLPSTGKTQSKLYLEDELTGELVLPPTLSIEADPEANGGSVVDNDLRYAVNGDNDDVWVRKMVFSLDDNVDTVTTTLTLTLPDTIISNRDINLFVLHPFPLFTVDIERVEYRLDGGWTLLPGWPKDAQGNPLPIQNAGNLKFYFPSVSMAQVRIVLRQRNALEENHKKVFYLGAQHIGLYHTQFQSSVGRFLIPLKLKGRKETKLVTAIRPILANSEVLSDRSEEKHSVFTYQLYMVDANGNWTYTRDSLPIMVKGEDVMLRVNLFADPQNGITPALQGVEVEYQDFM